MALHASAGRHYSPAEKAADGAIHALGFAGASVALTRMVSDMGPATLGQGIALACYAVGLLGMLLASALYNLWPPGTAKKTLGKVDQAMIFVMIAGSYTPFSVSAFPPWAGLPLCAVVWSLAALVLACAWAHRACSIAFRLCSTWGWAGWCSWSCHP